MCREESVNGHAWKILCKQSRSVICPNKAYVLHVEQSLCVSDIYIKGQHTLHRLSPLTAPSMRQQEKRAGKCVIITTFPIWTGQEQYTSTTVAPTSLMWPREEAEEGFKMPRSIRGWLKPIVFFQRCLSKSFVFSVMPLGFPYVWKAWGISSDGA